MPTRRLPHGNRPEAEGARRAPGRSPTLGGGAPQDRAPAGRGGWDSPPEKTTARLLCRVGPLRGADFDLDREATLGRHPECTVVLPVPAVSGRHARIEWDEEAGAYFLEDLGSLNGTELDGEPLSGRERLDRLHVITLGGKLDLIFFAGIDEQPVELPPALEREADGGTLIEDRPVELPAALGSPAGTSRGAPRTAAGDPDPTPPGAERTELGLEVLPLPGAIERPEPDAPDPEAPDPEPPAGDRG